VEFIMLIVSVLCFCGTPQKHRTETMSMMDSTKTQDRNKEHDGLHKIQDRNNEHDGLHKNTRQKL
jgi:hypothetical protein